MRWRVRSPRVKRSLAAQRLMCYAMLDRKKGNGVLLVDAFWHQWLTGLSEGMRALEPSARDTLLRSCGRACAAPEVLPRMRKLLEASGGASAFFRSVNEHIPGVRVLEVTPGLIYDFIYQECGCPLCTEQGLRDSFLCECSRHSLSWVVSELFPGNQPQVTLVEGILRGDQQCRLRVAFPAAPAERVPGEVVSECAIIASEVHRPANRDAE